MNTDVRGRSYSPKGKTPVAMAIGGTRQKLSMIASVTNQGKGRWMIIEGAFNHEKLIEFLASLITDAGRKVFLILDNLGVHHCKPVKAWLAQRRQQIEVFYLPSYSPELNPEERLNADLKHVIRRKDPSARSPNYALPPRITCRSSPPILSASRRTSRTRASSTLRESI